jgi:hypothetical protein
MTAEDSMYARIRVKMSKNQRLISFSGACKLFDGRQSADDFL